MTTVATTMKMMMTMTAVVQRRHVSLLVVQRRPLSAAAGCLTPRQLHEKAAGAGSSIIGPLEVVKAKVATGLAKEVMPTAGVSVRYVKSTQEKSLPEHHHHFVSPLARLTASASKLHLRAHHHNQ